MPADTIPQPGRWDPPHQAWSGNWELTGIAIAKSLALTLKASHMVRKEMFKKSFLLFCILFLAIGAKVSLCGNDEEAYIIGLRYPKSWDIRTYQPWPEIREVSYKVRLSFPSNDVVRFYDGKLINIGWLPFVQPNYPKTDRKWDHFIDGTVKGYPFVHQLIAYWINTEKTRMVWLAIRYHSIYLSNLAMLYTGNPIPNNNIQEVILQITPFDILPPPEPGKSY